MFYANPIPAIAIVAILLALPRWTGAEEPKDLTVLRDSWYKARAAALSPIDQKYFEMLTGLKARFTQAGDLEAVLAVQNELEMLSSTPGSAFAPQVSFLDKQSARPFPAGASGEGRPESVSADPLDVFRGKSVAFDWSKVKQVRFKVASPSPIKSVTYTGVAFFGFTLEARPKLGKPVSVGPMEGGNKEQTVTLDVPNLTLFDIIINNTPGQWTLIKSIKLE